MSAEDREEYDQKHSEYIQECYRIRCVQCYKNSKAQYDGVWFRCAKHADDDTWSVASSTYETIASTKSDDDEVEELPILSISRGRKYNHSPPGSPAQYADCSRTRAQSPNGSFYHDDVSSELDINDYLAWKLPEESDSEVPDDENHFASATPHGMDSCSETDGFEYKPTRPDDIRLLCISPGSFKDELFCSLSHIPLSEVKTSLLEFQALSYAWGEEEPDCTIHVNNISDVVDLCAGARPSEETTQLVEFFPFNIRRNLFNALKYIRLKTEFTWVWVDALCINQADESEKSQQLPKMPDIYSSAYNVIAWLGEDDDTGTTQGAITLIPKILNLKYLDSTLQGSYIDDSTFRAWIAFGHLLQRPWFKRRWVVQEVACARRLSVRSGSHVLSWLDFSDAVELYSDNIDRVLDIYKGHTDDPSESQNMMNINSSGAMALMQLSRLIFRKSPDSRTLSRMMSLESLVLAAAAFEVTDVLDTIYALLYLASDGFGDVRHNHISSTHSSLTADYTRDLVDVYTDFVQHCLKTSRSLDIICKLWAMWPQLDRTTPYRDRTLPSWVGVALYQKSTTERRRVICRELLDSDHKLKYDASRGRFMHASLQGPVMQTQGIVLGIVDECSPSIQGGLIVDQCLRMLGWTGLLEEGVHGRLWRTLVANRSLDGIAAPAWYRRACALALTKLDEQGNLDIAKLKSDASQPNTLKSYVTRVQEATESRRVFSTSPSSGNTHVGHQVFGLGPLEIKQGDMVCILFGCSVPVVLRRQSSTNEAAAPFDQNTYIHDTSLVGPCFVHKNMQGDMFVGMSQQAIHKLSRIFNIH